MEQKFLWIRMRRYEIDRMDDLWLWEQDTARKDCELLGFDWSQVCLRREIIYRPYRVEVSLKWWIPVV